jgi:hypothetical protein
MSGKNFVKEGRVEGERERKREKERASAMLVPRLLTH